MKLLIRTSSGPYGLGLVSGDGRLRAAKQGDRDGLRARSFADLLRDLLQSVGVPHAEITDLLVDLGPGGLSSTRVGVSFANAFAFAQKTPLVGVSALEAQMLEARQRVDLPVLSLRPAPGRQAFWVLYEGSTRTAKGCASPQEAIDLTRRAHRSFAVVGPLQRLALSEARQEAVVFIDVDPPRLESFALASTRAPQKNDTLSWLEPIVSTEEL